MLHKIENSTQTIFNNNKVWHVWIWDQSLQSCLTLYDPMTIACQVPLSIGILQARILEWVAMPSSKGIFLTQELKQHPLHLLHYRWILYYWAIEEAHNKVYWLPKLNSSCRRGFRVSWSRKSSKTHVTHIFPFWHLYYLLHPKTHCSHVHRMPPIGTRAQWLLIHIQWEADFW